MGNRTWTTKFDLNNKLSPLWRFDNVLELVCAECFWTADRPAWQRRRSSYRVSGLLHAHSSASIVIIDSATHNTGTNLLPVVPLFVDSWVKDRTGYCLQQLSWVISLFARSLLTDNALLYTSHGFSSFVHVLLLLQEEGGISFRSGAGGCVLCIIEYRTDLIVGSSCTVYKSEYNKRTLQ